MAQRTRSQRLNGLFPLSYTGVVPVSPVNFVIDNRPPTTQDFKNFYIGDLWLDMSTNTPPTNSDVWMLVSVTNNVATWVHFGSGGAGFLHTLTGNSGGPVPPDVNDNIDVIGDVNVGITIAGNAGANSLTVTTVSGNHIGETITGDSGGAVPFDAAGNINLVGGTDIDVTGNPGTNTLTIDFTGSGTGASDFVTDDGTATEVAGVINIIADNASLECGSSVLFSGSGNTVLLHVTDSDENTLIGRNAGNTPPLGNNNTSLGSQSLTDLTSGNDNTAIGFSSLLSLTTGDENIGLGTGSLNNLLSGNNNVALGVMAGTNYTGAESNNILIYNSGTVGENGAIRIGTLGTHSTNFQQGIAGVTVSNQQSVVIDTTTGQLGSTAISDSGAHDFVTDSGTAQEVNGVINVITDNAAREAGKSVLFTGLGDSVQLHVTDVTNNTFIGRESGGSLSSGSNNTAVGTNSLTSHTSGSSNTSLGVGSLFDLTSGSNNVAIGGGSLQNLVSGMGNIALGAGSGDNYTSSESANIVIGNDGQLGDGNTIRIGSGTHTRCFVQGIANVNVSNLEFVTINTLTGQLGSQAGGGGGSVAGTNSFLATRAFTDTGVIPEQTPYYMGTGAAMTERFDPDNVFFPGDGAATPASFTAPATGIYTFGYKIALAGPSGMGNLLVVFVTIAIVINGDNNNAFTSSLNTFDGLGFSRPSVNLQMSVVLPLNANDVVTFGILRAGSPVGNWRFTGGSGAVLFGGPANYIWGYRLH